MQKVVCVVCGLANLESFPTYPQCAGCGARLPQRQRRPIHDFFAQPVKTLVWAFGMGICVAILALISTGIARETRIRDRGPLIVSTAYDFSGVNDSTGLIVMMTVNTSLPGDDELIRNLRLRFNQKEARDADVRVLSPTATVDDMGGGRYFRWSTFKPGQTIKLRMNPSKALKPELMANGFDSYPEKTPAPQEKTGPVDLSPNRSN